MKLINTKTGSKTKINFHTGEDYLHVNILDFQSAADRLVAREQKGHHASQLSFMEFDMKNDSEIIGSEFDLEILYPLTNMTENTGKRIYLKVIE